MLSNNIAVAESTKAHPWERPHQTNSFATGKKNSRWSSTTIHHENQKVGLDPSHHLRRCPSRGLKGPSPGGARRWEGLEAPLKPPWSPSQAPLKSFLSPLEAPLKPFSSPLQAPFTLKPPSSPSQAPLKPFSSPLEAPFKQATFKPPWSPSQAPLKPSQAPLKPPWTGLKPRKPPSSPSKAPRPAPGNPSKPFPKGSFM